jgi:hypothetical protein
MTETATNRRPPGILGIAGPFLMGLLFFGALTPLALVMRLARRDPLRLRREPAAASYWVPRAKPPRRSASMRSQT